MNRTMAIDVSQNPREILKALHKEKSLYMDRVPKNSLVKFKQIAFAEFEGDYGMCLKMLLDNYEGSVELPGSQMRAWMEGMENRMDAVEVRASQPDEEKAITTGDGTKIPRGR